MTLTSTPRYDNEQPATERNVDGMKRGVRHSLSLLIFLSGRRETDGEADKAGEYEGPFTRWYCHEEMATARKHGLALLANALVPAFPSPIPNMCDLFTISWQYISSS